MIPLVSKLPCERQVLAFLAVGLVIPGIVMSWFGNDDDVGETRGLEAVPARAGN